MKNKLIALDSNIFIYNFEQNPEFVSYTNKIFKKLSNNKLRAITSIVSLIETLSYPMTEVEANDITEEFFITPNLTVLETSTEIAIEAAKIRRTYKLRLPDSFQLATALIGKAETFITQDTRLKKFKELKVVTLEEF